jgi:hypothetical protein
MGALSFAWREAGRGVSSGLLARKRESKRGAKGGQGETIVGSKHLASCLSGPSPHGCFWRVAVYRAAAECGPWISRERVPPSAGASPRAWIRRIGRIGRDRTGSESRLASLPHRMSSFQVTERGESALSAPFHGGFEVVSEWFRNGLSAASARLGAPFRVAVPLRKIQVEGREAAPAPGAKVRGLARFVLGEGGSHPTFGQTAD